MTEAVEPTAGPNITRLLLKAVKALPEEEQRVVFEHFFERGIGLAQPSPLDPRTIREALRLRESVVRLGDEGSAVTMFRAQKPIGPDQIMIPVRLSEDQHRRLKQWSAAHNFPMAVIVRGLIERFLDSWEKRTA